MLDNNTIFQTVQVWPPKLLAWFELHIKKKELCGEFRHSICEENVNENNWQKWSVKIMMYWAIRNKVMKTNTSQTGSKTFKATDTLLAVVQTGEVTGDWNNQKTTWLTFGDPWDVKDTTGRQRNLLGNHRFSCGQSHEASWFYECWKSLQSCRAAGRPSRCERRPWWWAARWL